MRTINFYLLRHGKVNGEPALYGHTDVLVDSDKQQAICQAVLDLELPIKNLVSSPLKRCADLARLLNQSRPQWQLEIDDAFKEINFGCFDGVPFESLNQHWPQLEQFWQCPAQNPLPEAESLEDFYLRVTNGWQQLIRSSEHDTLLICHGGTIRMILAYTLGLDWANAKLFSVMQIGNQSLTHIRITVADQLYPHVCSIGTPITTC